MKKFILAVWLVTVGGESLAAQNDEIISQPKFSGYLIGQYQATLKDKSDANTFGIRMLRMSITGRVAENFEYKVQGQINGNTSTLGESPRLVDAYIEWQRWKTFKIKIGQFKRPFTFENPMAPIVQGFMSYSQNVSKLAGFNDRSGEQASNGRDIGIQVQGDILPNAQGRSLLHYQVGVFNGQGINTKDIDNRKDVIGGLWIAPIKGLRIGAFGWIGSKAREGSWTDSEGGQQNGIISLEQDRYALSVEFKKDDWQLRSEYIHSTGYSFKTTYQKSGDQNDATVNYSLGDKADGLYVLCIAPLVKGKLRAKARYDLYRPKSVWNDSRTQYEIGLNWIIDKMLAIHTEYALINDRSLNKHNFSVADIELCLSF